MSQYDEYRRNAIDRSGLVFCGVLVSNAELTGESEAQCLYPSSSCIECPIGRIPNAVSRMHKLGLIEADGMQGVTRVLVGETSNGAKLQRRIGDRFYPLPRTAH